MSIKVRDGPSPLEAMEAAGGLGARSLSLRGMISLRLLGISQLNPDPVLENLKSYRYRAPKKPRRLHRLPPLTTKTPMIYQPPRNLAYILVINLFKKQRTQMVIPIMLLISSPSWTRRLLLSQVI